MTWRNDPVAIEEARTRLPVVGLTQSDLDVLATTYLLRGFAIGVVASGLLASLVWVLA